MSKKIKLGFADTHDHISQFFHSLLANRFDLILNKINSIFDNILWINFSNFI